MKGKSTLEQIAEKMNENDLAQRYIRICKGIGAESSLALANALSIAERVEQSEHWGIFENETQLQTLTRLKAWKIVKKERVKLNSIIEDELAKIVESMKLQKEPLLSKFSTDLTFKRGIFINLGRGGLTQQESLALLAAWSATPIL